MGDKIVVGPVGKGLRTDRLPFYIDNDSFPNLTNAYQWRGRAKRKRGTSLLGRLGRYFDSTSTVYSATSTITLNGSGVGNLLTGYTTLQTNASIKPGSVTLTDTTATVTYTDPTKDGYLTPTGTGGPNTINYATGIITIPAAAGDTIQAQFIYFPALPVMGLRDLILANQTYPGTLDFDTVYSYNNLTTFPYANYNVSYYKNPPTSLYPSYVQKSLVTPTSWNGQDYQQFYTVNYQGALWATNGITVPFSATNVGMQYKPIISVTVVSGGPPATATLHIAAHGLVVGDFVFINEVATTTGINFQTGYVITVTDANNVVVEFPNATIASNGTGGIAQYLTNRSDPTKDCLRWYDGDPTNGSVSAPVLNNNLGWVNFMPPLSFGSYSISDEMSAQYYLVGARIIVPFKDYLLFFGPVIQTSSPNSQIYLQDTVIWSQIGTPYYTASFTLGSGDVIPDPSRFTSFSPILVPINQTSSPTAYFEDVTGYGGFKAAGIDLPIVTVAPNQDVLITGFFNNYQTKVVFTGNNLDPFEFFIINSELGSSSTFSAITLDEGVLTRGGRGFVITNQTSSSRFDLSIPDQVFQISKQNNGNERMCAIRDFENEWVYFTYPATEWLANYFPNQTLFYNYRDNSWSLFNECYTTYGLFRKKSGLTWGTLDADLTWGTWNTPWGDGESTLDNPTVIGGNQQGYIMLREDQETDEGTSLYISNITTNTVTSPNHCLNLGDYILISNVLGTIGPNVNGKIFSVGPPVTANTFTINPSVATGTYEGGGQITRMYVPFIQTKQFPVAWEAARKTRLGVQQYLLSKTNNSQVTLLIYLSQSGATAFNEGPIVPSEGSMNNSLIYNTILYTCPESANLGLTPANTNLQMMSEISDDGTNAFSPQQQIWHRVNTSLIGDTVQVAITMSDSQMRMVDMNNKPINAFAEIEVHGMIFDVSASQMLS